MTSLNVKVQMQNCTWSEVNEKNVKPRAFGMCKVCQMNDTLLLLIGDITYAVNKGMPVVAQSSRDRIVFVFRSQDDDIMFGLSAIKSKESLAFKAILGEMMCIEEDDFVEEQDEKKESTSKVSEYSNKIASVISKGGKLGLEVIEKGTEKTKKGITIMTDKAKEKIPKTEQPLNVSPSTKARIEKAKLASGMAVTVSSSLLKGALEAANNVTEQLTPVLKEYLEKKGLKTDKPAGPKTDAAITVGKQSLKTAIELYFAMKEASVVLMAASLDATADLVEHRYGDDAGAAARDVAVAGKNALEASKNLGGIGVKQTAKKVLADTAIRSLDAPEEARLTRQQREAAKVLTEDSKNNEKDLATLGNSKALEMD